VGESQRFLQTVKSLCRDRDGALVGFDFPIGLPAAYARQVGIVKFREALDKFGFGEWTHFYQVSSKPSLHQPFYPVSCHKKGQANRNNLVAALGVHKWTDLLRRCECKTEERNAASCLFWTLGGNQVGRAACDGWKNVLAPALDQIKLWPFDGRLNDLMSPGSVVVAEIYPAEACAQMGVRFGRGTKLSKTRRSDRAATAGRIETWARALPITLEPAARSTLHDGFASDDHYDAFAGVLSMIAVVEGKVANCEPDDDSVRDVEGWILGQRWVSPEESAS
jgi:hypothetical protein